MNEIDVFLRLLLTVARECPQLDSGDSIAVLTAMNLAGRKDGCTQLLLKRQLNETEDYRITRLVDHLIDLEWVKREVDASNPRKRRIKQTKAGKKAISRLQRGFRLGLAPAGKMARREIAPYDDQLPLKL